MNADEPVTIVALNAAREAAGISQDELASMLGLANGKAVSTLLWKAKSTGNPGGRRDQALARDVLNQLLNQAQTIEINNDNIDDDAHDDIVGNSYDHETAAPESNAQFEPEQETEELDDPELAVREAENAARAGCDNPYVGQGEDALLKAVEALAEPRLNEKGKKRPLTVAEVSEATATARQIMFAAVSLQGGASATLKALLIGIVRQVLKCGERAAQGLWNEALLAFAKTHQKSPEQAEAERLAIIETEAAAERLRVEMEISELEAEVGHIMRDPSLMANIIKLAHDEGVVGEEHSVAAAMLVATSRLKKARAMAMVRLGPPASGKNYVSDIVLKMLPPETVIRFSGASQKALYYMGGEDPNALKHKIIYITEAAAIASRNGVEHEITMALRSLLSDDILSYQVVDGETRMVVTITKYGPIALIMTSARSNIEAELMTRLVEDHADESEATTRAVQLAIARKAAGIKHTPTAPFTIEQMRKYQRLLELKGPYDVAIPFADAVVKVWAKLPTIVRTRRDTTQIFSAVQASAILHAYQRDVDESGCLVATIDDYKLAFSACDPGVSAVYRPDIGPEVLSLVKVLEAMLAERVAEAKLAREAWEKANPTKKPGSNEHEWNAPKIPTKLQASYEQIRQRLGVASKDTVYDRVNKALAAEAIERDTDQSHSGVGRRRSAWTIKITSEQLETDAKAAQGLPTPEDVEHELIFGK